MSNETCWTTHKHVVSQHCLRVFGIDNQIFFNREIKNRRELGLKLGSPGRPIQLSYFIDFTPLMPIPSCMSNI